MDIAEVVERDGLPLGVAELAADRQVLLVVAKGLLVEALLPVDLTEAVECLALAMAVANHPTQRQALPVVGDRVLVAALAPRRGSQAAP